MARTEAAQADPKYTLTLTDPDGIVLDTWNVSGGGIGWDLSKGIGSQMVISEILSEIARDRKLEAAARADIEMLVKDN